jgi:hypothetical protein
MEFVTSGKKLPASLPGIMEVEVARMLANGLLAYDRAVGAAFYTSSRANNQGLKIKKIVALQFPH